MLWSGWPAISELSSLLWSGLFTGAVVALLAIAVVLCFRVSRVVNLAIGSAYVVGAFTYADLIGAGVPRVAAFVAVAGAGILFGAAQERLVLRRLRGQAPFTQLISTVGVAILVEGVVILLRGRQPVAAPALVSAEMQIAGTRVTAPQVMLLALAIGAAVGAHLWLMRSATGRAVLATTDDADAAMMLGINIDRLRLLLFGVAGMLGASLGVLAVPLFLVDYAVGLPLSLEAFIAAVLGGGLSPLGALGGGLLVGLVDSFGGRMFTAGMAEVLTASILVVVILLTTRFPAFRALEA